MSSTSPASAMSTTLSNKTGVGGFDGVEFPLTQLLEALPVPMTEKQPGGEETTTTRLILKSTDPDRAYLPGQPRIRLDGHDLGKTSGVEILDYLRRSHLTNELDSLLPFMKYIFVQTPSFRHIMALHHQEAHARKVFVNEHPGLHLVWYYERIFIKPIPAYFYSSEFWKYLKEADAEVYRAALGFMRSYYFLIQHEIDFNQACDCGLIPKKPGEGGVHPTYEEFCRFIDPFRHVTDSEVNRRFHYGELRLTRINRASIFTGRLAYFHIYPQWGSFLAHILAPIITIFAVCSVVLNSMQVTLQAQGMNPDPGVGGTPSGMNEAWLAFVRLSTYFPVVVIFLIAFVLVLGICGIVTMGVKDLIWAKTVREKKKRNDPNAGEKSHGMIW